jgi:hypothetical protein
MKPLLSMKKPEPVSAPLAPFALMETTEGETRAAIPATESGARSTVERVLTIEALPLKATKLRVTTLPKIPATSAIAITTVSGT